MSPQKHVYIAIVIFCFVIVMGTTGYVLLYPGEGILKALYMTIITIATVGYEEVFEITKNPAAEVFTIILIIAGILALGFAIQTLARVAVEGEFRQIIGRRRMEKNVSKLKDHFIVCGFGRIGRIVSNALAEKHVRFVVIDNNEEPLKEIEEAGYLGVLGDATLDEVLLNAGIKEARCLIATLTNDAENVFVTLTARQLNSQLCIVARAQEPEAEPKLKRAGANKVVLPYRIGALQIAQTALRPNVIDLVEIATGTASSLEYQIEELRVTSGSCLANKTLMELGLSRSLGIIVIGIRRTSEMLFNPSGDAKIHSNDILIALGNPDQLKKLEEMVT